MRKKRRMSCCDRSRSCLSDSLMTSAPKSNYYVRLKPLSLRYDRGHIHRAHSKNGVRKMMKLLFLSNRKDGLRFRKDVLTTGDGHHVQNDCCSKYRSEMDGLTDGRQNRDGPTDAMRPDLRDERDSSPNCGRDS